MRIDRKGAVVVAVAVATVLQAGGAGVAMWLRRAAERELASQQSQLAFVGEQLESSRRPQAEAPPASNPVVRLMSAPDVAGTLQLVQGIADAAGIELGSVKAAQSTTPGRQSFQISGIGTPDEVCRFLAGIEQSARLVIVESGRVAPGTDTDVAFEFGLATYHEGDGQ